MGTPGGGRGEESTEKSLQQIMANDFAGLAEDSDTKSRPFNEPNYEERRDPHRNTHHHTVESERKKPS